MSLSHRRAHQSAAAAILLILAGAAACGPSGGGPPPEAAPARASWIDESRLVDLTHEFDAATLYWPTNEPFRLARVAWGTTPGGWWYASNDYSASEHGGTHTDAPVHFHEGGWTLGEIPPDRFVGPAVVIDVSRAAAEDPDYAASEEDLRAWRDEHGELPDGAIVLVRTGWGARWPDRARYLGSAVPGDASNLHFPGFSEDLARALAASGRVAGVGIDTASLDPGVSRDFIAHRALAEANIYGLENVARLESLPPSGALLIALPMKIAGGTGGPTRILAVLPPERGARP